MVYSYDLLDVKDEVRENPFRPATILYLQLFYLLRSGIKPWTDRKVDPTINSHFFRGP